MDTLECQCVPGGRIQSYREETEFKQIEVGDYYGKKVDKKIKIRMFSDYN